MSPLINKELTGIFKGMNSGDIKANTPGLSSLYALLPGESHHKKNIKTIFKNLSENGRQIDWSHHQTNLEKKVNKAAMDQGIDAKVINDVYVASIMKDQDIMKEAVKFGLEMIDIYGKGGSRSDKIKNNKAEMDHIWPNQDLSSSKNTEYRGWTNVASSLVEHHVPKVNPEIKAGYLSKAIERNKPQLENLAKKNTSFNLEESMYIIRVMGQLRDVMKAEKKRGGLIPEFLKRDDNKEKFNRIRVKGEGSSVDRDYPKEHASSRSFLHRFVQPIGTFAHRDDNIYKVDSPKKGGPQRFDYLQGTSGTTVDMINFFQSHGKNKNETTRLTQAFYANWHSVAPDGNAHSQSESIGTMLQYLHRTNLQTPIMAPIKGSKDVESMISPMKGRKKNSKKTNQYSNKLKSKKGGYLYKN